MANTKVTQELIADDAIGAAQLASNAVVTASIANDAVTSAKLDTNLAVAGSLTIAGTVTANAGVNIDNISIDGTTMAQSSGDLILDVAGNIVLDADGGGVYFKDAGTTIGFFQNDSGDFRMISSVSDKDIRFLGNDGGSTINALTLDMSDDGNAIFKSGGKFNALLDTNITHQSTDVTAANNNTTVRIGNSGSGNGVFNALKFSGNQQDMYIMSINHGTESLRRLGFFVGTTAGDAVADEQLSILGSGKVGIGTQSPTQLLDVNGTVELNNLTIAGSQGSDGQVLTSTGSGVGWEDAAGGGVTFKVFGTSSIMVGDDATGTINAANYDTGLGVDVFADLTTGDYNTAIGYAALSNTTTANENTSVGYESMLSNITGQYNTAFGSNALFGNTTASENTAIGRSALYTCSTGAKNTIVGYRAGHNITTGSSNVCIGSEAGTAMTTPTGNVAIGQDALKVQTTAQYNTAIGYQAGVALSSAIGVVLVGYQAGDAITTGDTNICVGGFSMDGGAGKTGYGCTHVGHAGQRTGTSGNFNDSMGIDAYKNPTTGASNVCIGSGSGNVMTTGGGNSLVGRTAGVAISTGSFNSCLGIVAGSAITTGERNLCLGYDAGTSSSPNHITTGSNGIVLGNNATASAHIRVDWTVTSDKRDKTDIEPLTMGLNFVNKLEPVTYRWDMRSDYSKDLSITPDGTNKKQKLLGGLLAQDVEKVEREYGYKVEDETAILTDKHKTNGNYGLTYSKFIPVLINAIQELSTQVETLKTEVATLKGE